MIRQSRSIRQILSAALASASVAIAGSALAQQAVRIGVITDRTGNSADYARLIEEGVQLALKEVNAAGGMLGRKVELLWEDDEDKPQLSATKARKLADLNVPLIIQLSSSTATQQAQAATLETKTPHFAPNQSADTLTTRLDNPYFFQIGPLGSIQGRTLMAYAGARYKNVAVVTDSSALGRIIADSFKKGIEGAGIKIVAEQIIELGTTDAVPQLQRVRAANPDAIFQAGITTAEMALFFRAYHQLGMQKTPVLGSFNLSIPKYLELVPGMLDGVNFVDVFDPEKPETKAFIESYRKEYKRDPFSLPAYGYNAIYLVRDVVQRAGAFDREKIREAFAATKGYNATIGAKGTTIGFEDGKRSGFPQKGAVIRVIEGNKHGKVVPSGF